MILVPKKDADVVLRFIVFVRPSLLVISLFLMFSSVIHMKTGSMRTGMIHLLGAVVALLCHAVTCNDWKEE